MGPKTQRWTEISEVNDPITNEELILRNTYINSQPGQWAEYSKVLLDTIDRQALKKLKWKDEIPVNNSNLKFIGAKKNMNNM